MRIVKKVTYPDGSVSILETDVIDLSEIEEIVRSKVLELWSYPPFRDIVAVDTTPSSEVNTAEWSALKTYRYTARRELQVFELRIRSGVKLRNLSSNSESAELSALVNGGTIVLLASLPVEPGSELEDFIDVTSVVDIATASKDIEVELRARTSSEGCYVSLTPPILVEIGYLMTPRQKYRRVGDKLMVIPESVLDLMEREELERRVADRVLKTLEEEYELELEIDSKSGKGSARIKKRSRR